MEVLTFWRVERRFELQFANKIRKKQTKQPTPSPSQKEGSFNHPDGDSSLFILHSSFKTGLLMLKSPFLLIYNDSK